MCLPVRQKPVLYRNDWTSRAGFGHGNYIISVLHCIMKKFGYLFSVLNALLTHWRRRPPSHANRFGARRPSTPSVRTQLKATFLSLLRNSVSNSGIPVKLVDGQLSLLTASATVDASRLDAHSLLHVGRPSYSNSFISICSVFVVQLVPTVLQSSTRFRLM